MNLEIKISFLFFFSKVIKIAPIIATKSNKVAPKKIITPSLNNSCPIDTILK